MAFDTAQRLSILQTMAFCSLMSSGMIYHPNWHRPDHILEAMSNDHLHKILNFQPHQREY